MSEKIIILHPENQPEVDIYPIIKEGSIPNSVIDNQKIKSRTIINSNIALNTLKYEVLHQTLKDLIDSKITQVNMQNYLSSYYYNVEETQQYVGSEINTLHQTIQNEFYSNTAIDDMLMEKTDLSLFRQYLPGTYLDLTKQQDNQTNILNIHADGSIFLANTGNKNNSGNYYLPNSIVKTEDAPNGYFVLSTTNDDYQSLYNLGVYDKITTNDDGTYTITRQTGYLVLDGVNEEGTTITKNNDNTTYRYTFNIVNGYGMNGGIISNLLSSVLFENLSSGSFGIAMYSSTRCSICINGLTTIEQYKTYLANNNLYIQYKLATSYTEKVEKNHYARYNQRFILEHNKSEAERSATEGKVVHEKELVNNYINKTDITDMAHVVDSSDNAVSLETYGTEGYYVVPTKTYVDTQLTDKQDKLVSGTNIKTINGSSILGSGDITISGGNVGTDPSFNSVIVEQTGAENTGVKLYANKQGDLYSIKRADTSVNRKILTNSDINPSKVVLTNKQQKISGVTLFESLYVGNDYWKASITAGSNSNSQYYMILSANAGEFHFACPAKYNLKLITNHLTRHTTIYAPSKDGTIALLSDIPTIYGVSQLYQHHYKLEAIPSNDTIYVTGWSTQNTKILLEDITRYAFSNVQVYNSSNDETIQVIKWASSGFRYINDSGNIDSNGYTVTNYYINGEPTTY